MSDTTPRPTDTPIQADSLARMLYEDAVHQLKQLAHNNWRIGEIADRVEPKYGEATLQKLADESLMDYATLSGPFHKYV